MTHSLISVIVPVYNAGRFLGETLDALSRQSHKELEILCVDDGSTDDSSDIIKSHIEKDPRIKYIYQANAGPGAARNKGIELANGKYIAFQDSDDLLHPEALACLAEAAEKNHADVAICGFQSCNESLTDVNWNIDFAGEADVCMGDLAFEFQNSRKFRGHPWGKLYRRSSIGEIRFNDLHSGEDIYFNIDIAARSKCMVVIPAPLYIYRQAASSLTHQAQHHVNTIEAGNRIGLHCIELFHQNILSRKALLALIRRYSTNAICLHLLLMMGNEALSDEQRKMLLNKASEYLAALRSKMPFHANIFSMKYYWMYLTAIRLRSLAMLRLVCKLRRLVI